MSLRKTLLNLKPSLTNREPFIYYHLIKFEKPKRANSQGEVAGRATDYTYITDAPFNVEWDDGSVNSIGEPNFEQNYIANKIVNIGSVKEYTEARAGTLNLELTTDSQGAVANVEAQVFASSNIIDCNRDMVEQGLLEGDKIRLDSANIKGDWTSGGPYVVGEVVFNEGLYFVCISNHTAGAGNEPFVGASWTSFWNISNNTRFARIDRFGYAAAPYDTTPNSRLYVTPIDDPTLVDDSAPWDYQIYNVSEETDALITAKDSTQYSNYINREVFVYRVHANPETGQFIDDPFLLFKGIISNASLTEREGKNSTISWSLSSHWADFVRVQGRITSDEDHRALSLTGRSDEAALVRPEYATDYGFMHSDRSVNALGIYQAEELRYKTKKRGGLSGLLGGTKLVEYYETVDREVDIRFNLAAKYIPVVYGVQKVEGIPIFADLAEEDNAQLYVMYAICEGEIGGIYDIHIDDTPSVCTDEADSIVRDPAVGNAADDESNVEIFCHGRSDRGDVLAGELYYDSGSSEGVPYGGTWPRENYEFRLVDGGTFTSPIYTPQIGTGFNRPSNNSKEGLTHETTFTFSTPINATFVAHTGKPDQEADNTWVRRAAGSVNGAGFKIQADYFEGDPSNYWSPAHRLLDTAYVSGQFTLAEGEESVPQYEYVVKGKYINCYNYDRSFLHNPDKEFESGTQNPESEADFKIGDTVSVYRRNPWATISNLPQSANWYNDSSWQLDLENVQIIDKFFYFDKNGNKQWRFRWSGDDNLTELQESSPGSGDFLPVEEYYMVSGGNYWSMVSTAYSVQDGNVGSLPVNRASTYAYNNNGGFGSLTLTLDNTDPNYASFIQLMQDNVGEIDIMLTTAPRYTFRVEAVSSNVLTLSGFTAAVEVLSSQDYGSGSVDVVPANVINLGAAPRGEVNDTIRVTRIEDGIPTTRDKTISKIQGNFVLTKNPFEKSFIPGIDPITYGGLIEQDEWKLSPGNDDRVSTNPAMQLLDYLTSERYGQGLTLAEDIDLETFRESGRLCDDPSKVTVVTSTAPLAGDIYSFSHTNGNLAFQGKVQAVTPRVYPSGGTTYYEVEFTNCIGKLGRKWNDHEDFPAGELLWGFNRVISAPGGVVSKANMQSLGAITSATLDQVGGAGTLTVLFDRFGGVKNTNSIVRSWTPAEGAFSSPGYSLYDSDDVKYWKYLGWETQEQRWVTRHQLNQVIQTDTPIFDNINSMLRQFNGMLRYVNGRYELDIKTGAPGVNDPDFNTFFEEGFNNISEKDIIGDIKVDDKGMKNSFNSITANIVDPQNKFGARSISFFNSNYLKEDKSIPKQGNYSLPGVSNYYNARTNIIQYLDESRYGLTISFDMDPKGLLLLPGNPIVIQYAKYRWVNKYFRIKSIAQKPNGLVSIVADEMDNNAYLIEYADRNISETESPPVPIGPQVLLPPTNVTASRDLEDSIKITWNNSGTYDAAKQRIEIWAIEANKDEFLEYILPYENNGILNSTILDATTGTEYVHQALEGQAQVWFYFIRYVLALPGQTAKYSPFVPVQEPGNEDPEAAAESYGALGKTLGTDINPGLSVQFSPTTYNVEVDSQGNSAPGPYLGSGARIAIYRGDTPLTAVTGSPANQNEFTATVSSFSNINPGTVDSNSNNTQLLEFNDATDYTGSGVGGEIVYQITVGNVTLENTGISTTKFVPSIEGRDAFQINGQNSTHIFVADGDGAVITNDFDQIYSVSLLGVVLPYDNPVNGNVNDTYYFGPATFSAGISDVLIDGQSHNGTDWPVVGTEEGRITIDGSSTILDAGGPVSATISIPIYYANDDSLIAFARISLSKSFSGARGGSEFFINGPTGAITAANITSWVNDNPIDQTAAVNVATEVIALASDGFIRPNDRITITNTNTNETATRVFAGTAKSDPNSVINTEFSSVVVEFFDGSVIVQGTLSADRLAANTAFVNDIFVGSNLIVGSAAAGGGPVGQIYSYQKTSFEDGTPGFFMDLDGNFTVGSGSKDPTQTGTGLWYEPGPLLSDPGVLTIRGNVVIQGGNTQNVTWTQEGTAVLQENNTKVIKTGVTTVYDGAVVCNTTFGRGATAVCEPANTTRTFMFGLADNPQTEVYTGVDISYGVEFESSTTEAYIIINGVRTGSPFTYAAGDLWQVVNDGGTIRWFKNNSIVYTLGGQATGRIFAFKAIFKSPDENNSIVNYIGFKQGSSTTDSTQGPPGLTVNLAAESPVVYYNSAGESPQPANQTITATVNNTSSTLFYEFFEDGVSVQGPTSGNNTYTYFSELLEENMPETIKVEVRKDSATADVVATDEVQIFGLVEVEDPVVISLSNENHTFPATSAGVIDSGDYVGSGTDIIVLLGGTALTYDDSGSPANNTYSVTTTASNITPDPTPTTIGGTTRRYEEASGFPNAPVTAYIDFNIAVINGAGTTLNFTKRQNFNKARAGTSGAGTETVKLSADNFLIFYDTDGNTTDETQWSATSNNVASPQYRFGTINQSTGAFTETRTWANPGNPTDGELWLQNAAAGLPGIGEDIVVEVQVRDSGTPGTILATDRAAVYGLQSGDGAISVVLDNPTHAVQSDSSGVPLTLDNSGTLIRVFEGAAELTYVASSPGAGQYAVTTSPSTGITPGSFAPEGSGVRYQALAGFASAQDDGSITFNITGQRFNGTPLPTGLTAVQTFTKAKAGTGSDAFVARLDASSYVVTYDANGTNPNVATVTFTASAQNMGATPWFEFTNTGAAQTGWTNQAYSGTNTATFTVPASQGSFLNPLTIKVNAALNGSTSTLASDSVTIYGAKPGNEGENAVSYILTNATHACPADENGDNFNNANSGTDFRVFDGAIELEYVGDSYAQVPGTYDIDVLGTSNITLVPSPITTVTATPVDYARAANIATFTADTGYIDWKFEGTTNSGDAFEVIQRQTFTKAKQGQTGAGTQGDNGLKIATVNMYRRNSNAASVSPIAVDTTYTFATGTAVGPGGWFQEIPAVDGANQYLWVQTTVVVKDAAETTALITPGMWSAPVLVQDEGTKSANIFLYKRTTTTSVPSGPASTVTYTWAGGTLDAVPGWSRSVPTTGGDYLWVTAATAQSVTSAVTDDIATGEWSTPTLMAQNGQDGPAGPSGDPGDPGEAGAAFFSITSDAVGVTANFISTTKINGAIGRAYAVRGDVCIVVGTTGNTAGYRYNADGPPNNYSTANWGPAAQIINGDLIVDGAIAARHLLISADGPNQAGSIYFDGTNKVIEVYETSAPGGLRVKLGNLS